MIKIRMRRNKCVVKKIKTWTRKRIIRRKEEDEINDNADEDGKHYSIKRNNRIYVIIPIVQYNEWCYYDCYYTL